MKLKSFGIQYSEIDIRNSLSVLPLKKRPPAGQPYACFHKYSYVI